MVAPEPAPQRERPARLPACPPGLRLVASVVNDRQPTLSRAVVQKPSGSMVIALGGRIDDFTLELLHAARAELRGGDGSRCALTGFSAEIASAEAPPVLASPQPSVQAEEPKGKPVFSRDELTQGIRDVGHGHYVIARKLLQRALMNPGGAASGAWFRPEKAHGGMEVRAVREGSALAAMGIRNGDVARSVNGVALDTADGMLEALRAAREAHTISVAIERDGRRHDLHYTID